METLTFVLIAEAVGALIGFTLGYTCGSDRSHAIWSAWNKKRRFLEAIDRDEK